MLPDVSKDKKEKTEATPVIGKISGVLGRYSASLPHLHPAQEDDEQPPQPDPPAAADDSADDGALPIPKRDMRLCVSIEPHLSHATVGFDPKTSFSKSRPHLSQ